MTHKELCQKRDSLGLEIKKLIEISNGKWTRAGISFTISTTINNVPNHYDRFLSFFTNEQIPPELGVFISTYLNRLLKEQEEIWERIRLGSE